MERIIPEEYELTDGYILRLNTPLSEYMKHGKDLYKARVNYTLLTPDNEVLFQGEDYFPSPLHDPLGYESAGGILAFLTLRPGDTDDEYFQHYTEKRLQWVNQNAELYSFVWGELFFLE